MASVGQAELAITGLQEATRRFHERKSDQSDTGAALLSAVEAVAWARTAAEQIRDLVNTGHPERGEREQWAEVDRLIGGLPERSPLRLTMGYTLPERLPLVHGLRVARNRGLHQLAELVRVVPEPRYDVQYPKVYTHALVWAPYEDVQRTDDDEKAADGYRNAFEDRSIGVTLLALDVVLGGELLPLVRTAP